MAYNGLTWQALQLPLAAGLQQGTDLRARPQPFLDIARDVSFDELGGLQTRLPYTGQSGSALPDGAIFGGGAITNARRVVANGDELVLFTKDSLFSWNAQLSKWVLRGTHLAVAVDETPRFVTTGDQIDADRAELNGTVVLAWVEGAQVFAAAFDKSTGSVLVSPTAVSTAIGRPRLVALATKILLFVEASTTLITVRAIDPATPGTAIGGAGTTVLATDFNLFYDVVRAGTQDLCVGACRRQTTTSYTVFKVTPALVVTTATKALTCDGPIAVATISDGTQTQIVRANSTNIQGDLLTTSTLADVFAGQAIGTVTGTPVNQIAVEFVATTATVFWSFLETNDATNTFFATRRNTVTTANTLGTAIDLVLRVGVASRAFAVDGAVYVWLAFGEDSQAPGDGTPLGIRAQLQNTYFLYRADGFLAGQAVINVGGGYAPSTGRVAGVVADGDLVYRWAATLRRKIEVAGDRLSYAARSVREVAIKFDSNQARRVARLGSTLYVSGSIPLQYDGAALAEVGFLVMPWSIAALDSGNPGAIAAGTYSWKSTLRWQNAAGETERSTTATGVQNTVGAHKVIVQTFPLFVTRKQGNLPPPAVEFWRTEASPSAESPFALVTGSDPNVTTGDNAYLKNSPATAGQVAINDNLADADLAKRELDPEVGAVLENLAPPGASIIFASDLRIFLLDVTGDPDRGWYSKLRGAGEIAAFHDTLTFDVPRDGGRVTAGWFDDGGILYVARESAIYAFGGQGLDNLGQGTNYTLQRIISLDVGVMSQESVAMTPLGTILKSRKGWYLLAGGALQYIGGPVAGFDADTVVNVSVIETKHEVRILTNARMLVWDYKAATQQAPIGQWGERTVADGVDATIWDGTHVILVNDGISAQGTKIEQSACGSAATYGLDVESAWIKLGDLQGATSCRKVQVLGELRSACFVRLRLAYDYEMDGAMPRYVDDVVFDPEAQGLALVPGNALQFAHGPKRVKCQAIKARITAVAGAQPAQLGMDPSTGTPGLTPTVALVGGGIWDSSFVADLPGLKFIGELGNKITVSFTFEDGPAPFSIDVRRDFVWDPQSRIWSPLVNNVGVRVICRAGSSPTCAQLEAAITAVATTDGLFELDSGASQPGTAIDATAMAGVTIDPTHFVGGAFGTPTGEAIKLTGLGLEVGTEPGLFRRLAAAQKGA